LQATDSSTGSVCASTCEVSDFPFLGVSYVSESSESSLLRFRGSRSGFAGVIGGDTQKFAQKFAL